MHINKVISYNLAWETLLKKSEAYDEVCSAIARLDKEILSDPIIASPPHRTSNEEIPEITPFSFHRCWEYLMEDLGWGSYRLRSEVRGGINLFIRHFKDGVATKMMAADRMMNFPNWVLVESPKIAGTEFCDLSVLIVPMESEREIYNDSRRMGPHFYFERSLAQLNDLLPLNQQDPFLVIGISSLEEDIEVLDFTSNQSQNLIERVLEFPKEHYQAGVGILSYFGEIIKQKYPDIDAKVRIEQDGDTVRMIVDSPDGTRDIIEKTLDDYAMVVTKKAEPESLLEDQLQIQRLTSKLEIAELEVRQTTNLLKISEKYSDSKIDSLEGEVSFLREQVGSQMHHMNASQSLIHHQSVKEEKLLLTQIDSSQRTVKELAEDSWNIVELKNSLLKIQSILEQGAKDTNENEAKIALEKVRDTSPEVFNDLSEALKNTAYGVSGNIVFQWLQQISCMVV